MLFKYGSWSMREWVVIDFYSYYLLYCVYLLILYFIVIKKCSNGGSRKKLRFECERGKLNDYKKENNFIKVLFILKNCNFIGYLCV